jgi:hypothetical protein
MSEKLNLTIDEKTFKYAVYIANYYGLFYQKQVTVLYTPPNHLSQHEEKFDVVLSNDKGDPIVDEHGGMYYVMS